MRPLSIFVAAALLLNSGIGATQDIEEPFKIGTFEIDAQRFLQPGEVVTATIEGIGTLRMSVVAEDKPKDLSGAELPPVRTYRE